MWKRRVLRTVLAVAVLIIPAAIGFAQIPDWSRFAPADAARRMESVATDLEAAILDFQQTRDATFRRLSRMSMPPELRPQVPVVGGDAALDEGTVDGTGNEVSPAGEATNDGAPPDAESIDAPPPGDVGTLRSEVSEGWTAVEELYGRLAELVLEHPPAGGTVLFAAVERYLLSVHQRLGGGIEELTSVRDDVSAHLTQMRDREAIETYLAELSSRDTADATQTHLQFLLQETMAEWWLTVLFGLDPADWIESLQRQARALTDAELERQISRTISALETRDALYDDIRALPDPSDLTISAVLASGAEAVRTVYASLARLGLRGAATPFARDPVFRASVVRLHSIDSVLSTGQRLDLAARLDGVAVTAGRAVAAGLVGGELLSAEERRIDELVTMADEAFSATELSRRSADAHASYRADGEAAVNRLLAYLESSESRSEEQLRWSTLAVLENRHAQMLIAGGSYPRVQDYLDSYVRRTRESVDPAVTQAIRTDFIRAVSGAGVEDDLPAHAERLAAVLPPSARRGTISVRLTELSSRGFVLPYDRTVGIRVRSESDTGVVEGSLPTDLVTRYYAEAFRNETRPSTDADNDVAVRWMHTHGQSAVDATEVEASFFEEEWRTAVESAMLAAALPWLAQAQDAVDFVQEADFRARAYSRIHGVIGELVDPALDSIRPVIDFTPRIARIVAILRSIAAADISTQIGEARIAAVVGVTPPSRLGFSPRVLIGGVVGSIGEELGTTARTQRELFRYARVSELRTAVESIDPAASAVVLLNRIQAYGDRGWIDPVDASILRRRLLSRLTGGEDTWVDEQ